MDEIVDHRNRSLPAVIGRRRWVAIATALICIGIVMAAVFQVKPKYGATAHVLLLNDTAGRDPASVSGDLPVLATGTVVLSEVKRELNLSESLEDLQEAVAAHVSPRSTIMTIAARDHDRGRAIQIANAAADAFVQFYARLPQSRANGELHDFDKDLAADRARLTHLDQRLEGESAGQSYVGTQTSLDALAGHLGELREQRADSYAQLAADKAAVTLNSTLTTAEGKIAHHEILAGDPGYTTLQTSVATDQSAYVQLRSGVTDQFPGLVGARDKVQRENQVLVAARQRALSGPDAFSPTLGAKIVEATKAKSALIGDQARVAALDQQIDALGNELSSSAHSSDGSLAAVRAMRDAAENTYNALALRYANAESQAAESNTLGHATVVDRAVVAEPSLLGPNLLLVIGFALSILAAIGAAYLAETMNPRLIGKDDVEYVYGRPTIATLR